ncbi:MAG: hypothetical protein R2849_00020 [Thermomicrobiales bacterium]
MGSRAKRCATQLRRDSTEVTVVRVVSGKPADYRIVAHISGPASGTTSSTGGS